MMEFKKIILTGSAVALMLLACSLCDAVQALTLPVPSVAQEQTEWCWAGVGQATLLYFETDVDQCTLADWARLQAGWGADDCCLNPSGTICNQPNNFYGEAGSLQDILSNWGVETEAHDSALTLTQIETIVDNGTPYVMRWAWEGGGAHMVVGTGYSGDYISYMDPWPGIGYQSAQYEWVVSEPEHEWTHSLGNACLPPGHGDVTGEGIVNIGDVVSLITWVHGTGPPPDSIYTGNADGCCFVDAGDVGYLAEYIFTGGQLPAYYGGGAACLDDPGGDTIELRLITPPVPGEPDSLVRVDLYVTNNRGLSAASMGFQWDNPDVEMVSAQVSSLVQSGFMAYADPYYLESLDSTNLYRRFSFAGSIAFFGALGGSAAPRLWVTYTFKANVWTPTSVLTFESLDYSRGVHRKFAGQQANWIPGFAPLIYSTGGILRPEPGAIVHLDQAYPIHWVEKDGISAYTIDLSRNSGTDWVNLASDVTGDAFIWIVDGDTTSEAMIRIYDSDVPSPSDTMFSGVFVISEGVFFSVVDPGGSLRAQAKTGGTGTLDSDPDKAGPNEDLLALYENGTVDLFSGNGNGTFSDTGTIVIEVDSGTTDLAIADIDRDGNLDVAIVNELTQEITLHRGAGDGTFTSDPGDVISMSAVPSKVRVADYDRDGDPDISVVTPATNEVLIYSGIGDGVFDPTPATISVSGEPTSIASGYIGSDNILDLAVAHGTSGTITIFSGNGDGSFSSLYEVATGQSAGEMAIGDFDSDGDNDVAVSYPGDYARIVVLENDGVGVFDTSSYETVFGYHSAVETGDLTGDGLLDIAVACEQNDTVAVLQALADGGFGYPVLHEVGQGPIDLRAGDYNTDGVVDMICFNKVSQDITVLLGEMPPLLNTDISVVSPAGGEEWTEGTEYSVNWTKGAGVASVDIELSRDSGSSWEPVAVNYSGTAFDWLATGPPTTSALLRVSDHNVPSRSATSAGTFTILSVFICGDADGSGEIDIDDVVYLIQYIFASGPPPDPIDSGEVDCTGEIDIDDVVYLIAYIFASGPVPCEGCM